MHDKPAQELVMDQPVVVSNVSESEQLLRPELLKRLKLHNDKETLLEYLRELGHIQQSISILALARNRGPRIRSKEKVWTTILNGAIQILETVQKEDLDSIRALLILTKEEPYGETETK